MPKEKPLRRRALSAPRKQTVGFLRHDKGRLPCDWPECAKAATNRDGDQVYCPDHFFAAVSKHWAE